MKDFKNISCNITEAEYRTANALSYSTVSRYEREGFENIKHLFDKLDTPSLTLGSCVDSLITGGEEEFNERFLAADFPSVPDSITAIVIELFDAFKDTHTNIDDIPDKAVISLTEMMKYQLNWKPETRAKVIKEKGKEYYQLLYLAEGRTIIDLATYHDVLNMVDALKGDSHTRFYFGMDSPFDNIKRYYQLKFFSEYEGIPIKCMIDEAIVDYDNKTIQLIDLKTTKSVTSFIDSFYKWGYFIQSQMYTYIVQQNIMKDDYFSQFKILDYKFIAIDKNNLLPIVFKYGGNHSDTSVIDTSGNKRRNWRELLKECHYYLEHPDMKLPIDMMNAYIQNDGVINIRQLC